jgi:dihydropteroate synthase
VLQATQQGKFVFYDAQAERIFEQTVEQFSKEWSGIALVLNRTTDGHETPWMVLSDTERKSIYGGCCGVEQAPNQIGQPTGGLGGG